MVDVIHHAQEIDRFVADIRLLNVGDPAGHSIDCFIGEFFSQCAAARSQNRNQSPANLFVEKSSAFAVRIKPVEQPIEILLPEFPELFRG